jgi:hypothetical protein
MPQASSEKTYISIVIGSSIPFYDVWHNIYRIETYLHQTNMKTTTAKYSALLKKTDRELNVILENDMRKTHPTKDAAIRNAFFLLLIAA